MKQLFLIILCLVIINSQANAQEQQATPPDWVMRYLESEPEGRKFGNSWFRRIEALQAQRRLIEGREELAPGMYSLQGEFGMPVLAGTFSDITPRFTPSQYQSAFFGPSGYTLSHYFTEVSGGVFTFAGIVTQWITLPQTRAYYIDGFSNNSRGKYREYANDLLNQADSIVQWELYDNDGPDGVPNSGDDDGYVDMVVFMHPLVDAVYGQTSQAGFLATGYQLSRAGGIFTTSTIGASGQALRVNDFVLSAGLHPNGNQIATMNINIHEMGHALGLPDLNDMDRSSYGVGIWDVMGYGLYLTANTPAFLGAWSRRQLGWADVQILPTSGPHVLAPVVESLDVLRIDIPQSNEYLLIENRQRLKADLGLPGTGLVIWHVDEDILLPALNSYRGTENEQHPGLRVIQADGRDDLAFKINTGDAGDTFPGSTQNRNIDDYTAVNARGYSGAASGIQLHNIIEVSGSVTFEIGVLGPLSLPVTQDLRDALLGELNFEEPLVALGGTAPLIWEATSVLPSMLSLSSTGILSCMAEELGEWTFGFRVSDALGDEAEGSATFSVVMPVITGQAALEAITGATQLDEAPERALDLVGNQNGRLDIGDVYLFLKDLQNISSKRGRR